MGEANQRGEHAERREQAMTRMLDEAEVLIALTDKDGGINIQCLPRDEEPNAQSLAVILAGFINANLAFLTQQAVASKLAADQPQAHVSTAGGDLRVIASRPVRSITAPDGGLAAAGPVIVGPNGERL